MIKNLPHTRVKITKRFDKKFEDKHPNGINPGAERIGHIVNLEVGKGIFLQYSHKLGYFKTSHVEHISDTPEGLTVNTENSIYYITPYHNALSLINLVIEENSKHKFRLEEEQIEGFEGTWSNLYVADSLIVSFHEDVLVENIEEENDILDVARLNLKHFE